MMEWARKRNLQVRVKEVAREDEASKAKGQWKWSDSLEKSGLE